MSCSEIASLPRVIRAICAILLLACNIKALPADDLMARAQAISPESLEIYFLPKLEKKPIDMSKVLLGQRLFSDVALSSNGKVSCVSCHDLGQGGDDGRPRSIGASGHPSSRNAPSVFYASEHIAQFWDGRASSLEEQIDGPVHHPNELASNWPEIEKRLGNNQEYLDSFETIYQTQPTSDAIKDAIAEFERSLVAINSPFDLFLAGDSAALSEDARVGAGLFVSRGCVSCHQGPLLGANMYQKIGVYFPYESTDGNVDLGRYNVTNNIQDKNYFKVPSLRNVALTAPYLHDGSAATLEEAIDVMAFHQLGRKFSTTERSSIAAFLRSLTDAPSDSENLY